MQGKYILKIDEISTYDIKIENIEEMKNSIFIDAYKEAYRNLNSIIEAQNQKKKNKDKFIDKSINNIIAFIGERGSGKTSCMKSFLRAIENNEYLESEMENRMKVKFEILDMIEPSFFTDKINIIELVISNLFKKFSEKLEKKELEDYEKKKKLLNEFQEMFKALKYMGCKEEYQNSEIEELLMLSTTVSFKERLQGLIKSYLEFIKKDKLVISVDDIDFNMNHAYEMVEGIRKYLTLDDVVIVINLKMEQLELAINEKYISDIKNILQFANNKVEIFNKSKENVIAYLIKILPIARRIKLKDLAAYNLTLIINNKEIKVKNWNDYINELILEKTSIDLTGINKFFTSNLREFINFYFLIQETDIKLRREKLKEYFYSEFENKAEENQKEKIKNILNLSYNKKNRYILDNFLIEKSIKMTNSNSESDRKIKPLLPEDLSNTEKSEGIINIIKLIRELEKDYSNVVFKEIIEVFYSIFINEVLENKEYCEELFGKDYLRNFEVKLEVPLKSEVVEKIKKEEKILSNFIIEEKAQNRYLFSPIAPYYQAIFGKTLNKAFIPKNLKQIERIYYYLENILEEILKKGKKDLEIARNENNGLKEFLKLFYTDLYQKLSNDDLFEKSDIKKETNKILKILNK